MKSKAIKWINEQITENTTKAELDIVEFLKKCVREYQQEPKNAEKEQYIDELFAKFYKVYCRHTARQQGLKTFRKKLIKLKTNEEILDKARKIAKLYAQQREELEARDVQYRPLCSSWLSANIPD